MPSDWSFVSVDIERSNQCGSKYPMFPREGITRPKGRDEQKEFGSFWNERGVSADMSACHGRCGNLKESNIYKLKASGMDSGRCGLFQFHIFVTWEA
jgi:hypothetical protein